MGWDGVGFSTAGRRSSRWQAGRVGRQGGRSVCRAALSRHSPRACCKPSPLHTFTGGTSTPGTALTPPALPGVLRAQPGAALTAPDYASPCRSKHTCGVPLSIPHLAARWLASVGGAQAQSTDPTLASAPVPTPSHLQLGRVIHVHPALVAQAAVSLDVHVANTHLAIVAGVPGRKRGKERTKKWRVGGLREPAGGFEGG